VKEEEERFEIEQKLAAQPNTTKHSLCAVRDAKQPYLEAPAAMTKLAIRWFFGLFPHHTQKEQLLEDPCLDYTTIEADLQGLLKLPEWNQIKRNKCIKLIIAVVKATNENLGNAEEDVDYSAASTTTSDTMSSTEKSYGTDSSDSREPKAD